MVCLKYNIGDIVKVVNYGCTYDAYGSLADKCDLQNWVKYDIPKNGTIHKILKFHYEHGNIYAIEDVKTKQQYLIGESGIKPSANIILPDELFEI